MLSFLRKILGQRFINYYHLAAAALANFIYGFPSRSLRVIGVTGTDGKTTTVNMIASILRTAGKNTSHLSTVNAQIGSKVYGTGLHTTTPSSFGLQRLLRKAVSARSEYVVLEITSHALDQYRTWGIRFETAVVTNVSHEHLDYHRDLVSYMAAKAKLLRNARYVILNMDDKSFSFFSGTLKKQEPVTYGLDPSAKIWADGIKEDLVSQSALAHTPAGSFPVTLNLSGQFNLYNALAAIGVATAYGLEAPAMQKGLSAVKNIPGRLEIIPSQKSFSVMVDFAHTPNALEKLLRFLRPKVKGRIIHVFGSAGERDKVKRPLMGGASDRYADMVILTREDNRSESLDQICHQIALGISQKMFDDSYFIMPNRREAIRFALFRARPNDLVIITGKGHEQSLNVDGIETPWDDRAVAREELSKL
ncbi:MAG: hypothetical protein A3C85_04440 [Candidatus Doudnabacteria bacterium RIFCSPHIGHO2_02_FULL_48_21]|uniref:UDP-N-acetylmuramoyl-L-alanyl-D-glutamate--2, 6-diaminopimelate ligase n=1 Tax=Candidatus Doudnabacteria bacterium RIFCSPLOWO2_02_FULL_48_13 TaxID=1817845 RepID=A0A1F5QCE0_9BACT|nr:MAG: hypothetical protein A3K05_00625 [Candidatus Doudnabacteria bacterium RIFCSPHIGHO2_01_48_18]OGE79663.1 MAG: hypothetical protein A2668_01025 [Candidatus Doudnabacteria bacterium RIFCSPHIGHO2_01_FULL_48_180]OGE91463.1 MAG: hypothetical protein A3F44_01225 [Candidatus Doudnabacteria bacterium RIFCSPHIGHO2_12_FULL_47_25]OGE93078.1 MAG: hypothetical protein A3C85_04440 [Candidatus Doudnabacteria bacterium RIFCSPHIGHO2_02_FULL_48_21]OGE98085.1 MAG: hypothetical protein A3A83_02405 [Candidatu